MRDRNSRKKLLLGLSAFVERVQTFVTSPASNGRHNNKCAEVSPNSGGRLRLLRNDSGMGMVDRRQMLKSAGILIGASALKGCAGHASAQSEKPKGQSRPPLAGLRKKMMGFMVPHEQLPAPGLTDWGGNWPVSTDSSAHLEVINELFASGATIVNIHCGQADQARVIDFYGREGLPLLKRSKTDGP
jgi:hypothetical protein